MDIKKVLIANRGEIAVRVEKTARKMGINTVAIYSKNDTGSLHVLNCDEAYKIDGESLSETYLNIDKIIEIALKSNCDAIHPGYGFLSENSAFSKACADNNIRFVGPGPEPISAMGNKLQARQLVSKIGVPITHGLSGKVSEILSKANKLKFPVLIKAASGGGGKGMRIVYSKEELKESLFATSREAENYFGDGTVYVEQYLESPRHIEVQVLADNYGNVIHLFERECSLQRRYQKIIEEAPSVTLDENKRNELTSAAVKIAKEINYSNAGTIEFLVDKKLDFYFLEMNTRIQVEHPVTEMITGIDIVEEQFKVCSGEKLSFSQNEIKKNGHAIEARIYAEAPENNFAPSSGKMSLYLPPQSNNYRIDSAYNTASEVFPDFDPMISKFIVHDKNRADAISQLENALNNYYIQGIKTNIQFLRYLVTNKNYVENKISTSFIENNLDKLLKYTELRAKYITQALCSAVLISLKPKYKPASVWESIGYWRVNPKIKFTVEEKEHEVKFLKTTDGLKVTIENKDWVINEISYKTSQLAFSLNNEYVKCHFSSLNVSSFFISINGFQFKIIRNDILDESVKWETRKSNLNNEKILFSPLPGKVVKINVKEGQKVIKGQDLIIIEAMKMENKLVSKYETVVKSINVSVGQQVAPDIPLIEFENNSAN